MYIPDDVWLKLSHEESDTSLGDEQCKMMFRSHMFNALMDFVPIESIHAIPSIIDINMDPDKSNSLVNKVREYAYVKQYICPEGSKDNIFWKDVLNTLGAENIFRKMDSWNKDWRKQIK